MNSTQTTQRSLITLCRKEIIKSTILNFSILFFLSFCLNTSINGQVSGTVFNDYSADGTRDGIEPGFPGITVTGYAADGTVYGPVTSAADGSYSLPGVNQATRIEFTWPSPGPESTASGGTSVQFVSGSVTDINFGIFDPYVNCAEPNPDVVLPCYVNGQAAGDLDALISLPWESTGTTPSTSTDGTNTEIGSTWGTGYDRDNQLLYSGAFLKRHSELADGLGSIYVTDYANGGTTTGPIIDISNVGTIGDRMLSTVGANSPSRDPLAFTQIGKIGLGGIEVSRDGKTLWAVNLNAKTVVPVLNIDSATPTEGTALTIPNPGCSSNPVDWRPFALKHYHDALYVGGVCSGETGGVATMRYYVYRYDLNTSAWDANPLIDESLNYPKGHAFKLECDEWNPWITDWSEILYVENDHDMCHPQAMLSDIEFDVDGDMIIIFMDRLGHQGGAQNQCTAGCTDNNLYSAIIGGDVLRADFDGSAWSLESNGLIGADGCGSDGQVNGFGGGAAQPAEYYCDEFYDGTIGTINTYHFETIQGSGIMLPGTNELLTTNIDPFEAVSGGLMFHDNETGRRTDAIQLYDSGTGTSSTLAKANGLGELEILCSVAPVEIGNLVWNDLDSDGVQDANEQGIQGVNVELYDPTSMMVLSTATTDANGNYIFSTASGSSTSSNIYGLDLNYNETYQVRIVNAEGGSQQTPLDGLEVTSVNSDASANGDARDSDGTDADISIVSFTLGSPGENDHTYDFGFRAVVNCANPSAPVLAVMNNVCPSTTGSFNVATPCSATSTIEYSIDGGSNWVASLPTWSDGITLIARCVDNTDMTCVSPNSSPVSAVQDPCTVDCPVPNCATITIQQN